MRKRIIALLLLIFTLASSAVISFAEEDTNSSMPLDTTTVEQDFLVAGFNTEDFYSVNDKSKPTIAFVTDYYDDYFETNPDGGNFYLYVWFYYPNLDDMKKQLLSVGNIFSLCFSTSFADAYGNTDRVVDGVYIVSDESCSFHKVRFDVGVLKLNLENERKYDILSFSCFYSSYSFKKSYVFKGTHKDKDIIANSVFDEVVSLKPKSTVYLTASSPKIEEEGVGGWRTAVYSVYFTVPKEFEDKNNFDYLRAIEFSYYEQLFNAVVTSADNVWEELITMKGVEFSTDYKEYNEKYPNIYVDHNRVMGVGNNNCAFAINPKLSGLYRYAVDTEVLNMFKVKDYEDEDLTIDFEKIEEFFDYTQDGEESAYVSDKIYIDDTFNVESFSGKNPSLWKKFVATLYGFRDMYEVDLTDVSPIVKINDAFFNGYNSNLEEWCGNHLVAKQDAADFKAAYEEAKAVGDVMYQFRFAQRDYYAHDCVIFETDFFEVFDVNGFYARGTAFNDFDIISLTYRKNNGSEAVVYVEMTPIDVGPDIVGPTRTTISDFKLFFGDLFEGFETLMAILSVLLLVLVLFVVLKPIFWIIDKLFGRKKKVKERKVYGKKRE